MHELSIAEAIVAIAARHARLQANHEVVVPIQHTMLAILLVGQAGRDFLKIGV